MQDSTMIKISLVLILTGIPLLAFLSNQSIPPKDNREIYSDKNIIHVDGIISHIKPGEKITRAQLQTCINMPLVFFEDIDLIENKKVKLIAKKDSYQGKPQLIVEELEYI